MKILVLADTHIPDRAKDLPLEIYEEAKNVDLILHAGDFVTLGVYEKLKSIKKLRAVSGNMDSCEICTILKPKEIIKVNNFKIGLMHGSGSPQKTYEALNKAFAKSKVDCIIFGHLHIPQNEVKDGVLYFNPGSPTDKIFAPYNSYGILEITDKIEGKIVKL